MVKIGSALKQREQQYVATREEGTGTWRILDTFHKSLENMEPDDDIPNDHPALTLVSEGAFIALVKEATALGVLENAALRSPREVEKERDVEAARIQELEEQLRKAQQETPLSESFRLKKLIADALLKLSTQDELSKLG